MLDLPESLDPQAVQAVAMDLDRTILGASLELAPRLVAAVKAVAASGVVPIVATGRMLRSSRPFALQLGVTAPLICYQGAMIADPASGQWLFHDPMPVELARQVIAACRSREQHCNVYVDDELYVDELNLYALEYARHAKLEAHSVGNLEQWLTEPTTKIVVVGEPDLLDALQIELRQIFGPRLFIAKSLPFFLEVAQPDVSKGSALRWVCRRIEIDPVNVVAFGDGANDIELLQDAGLGIAVADADPVLLEHAQGVVPSVEQDGVARFLEALVSARA
jgi:Cof subfamily protein (haloacid dehalogenase superfamily)